MVEEEEILNLRLAGDLYAFKPARMAPPLAHRGKLLRGILRIIDQDICSVYELPETSIEFRHARFVVGSVDDRSCRRVQAVAEASLGMIHPGGGNLGSLDLPIFAAGDFTKRSRRRHRASVDREIGARELRCEHLAKAIGAERLRLKTIEMEMVV